MKNAAPRIFRSLERQSGPGEFDNVVAAAVAAFGSLRNPSATQIDDLGRLVVPLWPKISNETKRNLAAWLSHSKRVPRPLVELLVCSPLEISAPFLVSSPTLDPADIARLSQASDERMARLMQNRTGRPGEPPPVLQDQVAHAASPADLTELDGKPELPTPPLAADFLAETPLSASEPSRRAPAPRTADDAREMLRRLAMTGRAAPAKAPPTFADLMRCALEGQEEAFYETLASIFSLEASMLEALRTEASGELLAVALKALKASSADALSILMLIKPSIGLDVAAFDSTARFYKALKPEDCRAMVEASKSRARHMSPHAPETYRDAEPVRRDFGRRQERPLPRQAKG